MAVTVIKGGLETTVQDYPGRKGAFGMGFPPSGPIDHWSFRLANVLAGNAPGAAASMPFIRPALRVRTRFRVAAHSADSCSHPRTATPCRYGKACACVPGNRWLWDRPSRARTSSALRRIARPPSRLPRTFVIGACGGLTCALEEGQLFPRSQRSPGRGLREIASPRPRRRGWGRSRCRRPHDD